MYEFVNTILIDEEKEYSLFRICKRKKQSSIKIIKSDHCTIFVELDININKKIRPIRETVWSFTDEGMNKFRQLTEKNEHLQMIWKDQNITVDQAYGKWSKELNSIMHQSFHKRRIKHSHNTQILPQLFKKLRKIQKLLKENQTDELQKREKEVSQQINERQYEAQEPLNQNEFYKTK